MKKIFSLILAITLLMTSTAFSEFNPTDCVTVYVEEDGTVVTRYDISQFGASDILGEENLNSTKNSSKSNKALQKTANSDDEPLSVITNLDAELPDEIILDSSGGIDSGLPETPIEILTDGYIDNTEYDENNAPMNLMSADPSEAYNTVTAPTATNITTHPTYSLDGKFSEYISPYSGEMSLKFSDVSLRGKNGLNFGIERLYQTNQSTFGDRKIDYHNGSFIEGFDHSTYLQTRYNLGMGWSFALPSVEVRGDENNDPELYYHTGNGNVYKVNFYGNTRSNLENYYTENLRFLNDSAGSYTNTQVNSRYYVKLLDGTCQYFAKDGRLIGIKDRFGNVLKYEHTEMPVTNLVPNGTFTYAENAGYWECDGSLGYNNGVMRFTKDPNNIARDGIATSSYMTVTPGGKYVFNGSVKYGLSNIDKFNAGNVTIKLEEYSENRIKLATSFITNGSIPATYTADWINLNQSYTLGNNTRYVKIVLSITGGKGDMAFDNICYDRKWPLITKITDTTGKITTIDYGSYIYDTNITDTKVSIRINNQRSIIYDRQKTTFESKKRIGNVVVSEDVYSWAMTRQYEQGILKQSYNYEDTNTSHEYFSFLTPTHQSSTHPYIQYRPIIKELQINNTKFVYNYARTAKALGEGYYHTKRVTSRQEHIRTGTGDNWDNTALNKKTYSYTSNETAYPSSYTQNHTFSTTVTQDNGLQIKHSFTGSSLTEKITKNTADNEQICENYFYNNYLKDMPSTIITERSKPNDTTITTYQDFDYEEWGGVSESTQPMTEYERINQKEKFTTTYEYHKSQVGGSIIYAMPKRKTWYNSLTSSAVSEAVEFDNLGRAVTITNAKGEITEIEYDDWSDWPWMPVAIIQRDINNMHGTMNVDYIKRIPMYLAGIYPTMVEEYIGNSRKRQRYSYNSTYDVTTAYEDELGNMTYYAYDTFARLTGITYPSSKGENDTEYTVSKAFSHETPVVLSEYGNRAFYKITEQTKKDDSVYKQTDNYFDDYGNLRILKEYENGSIKKTQRDRKSVV